MTTPRTQYIMRKYDNIRMEAYINLKHNKKAIKQIQKRVAEILSSTTFKTINAECSICLKEMHKNEHMTLECNHSFHTPCIFKWALKNKLATGKILFKIPVKNRHIYIFKKDSNIFTCPCCSVEYTLAIKTKGIKRILATIHLKDGDDDVVHYITDQTETLAFVPLSEVSADNRISKKWVTILSLLKFVWEHNDTNIYAVKRLHPEPEFILTHDKMKIQPLLTGAEILNYKPDDKIHYMRVDIEELRELLNEE